MNQELQNKTELWMALERKTNEQRKQAEEYYQKELMDLITEDYIDRNSDLVFESVKYLMVSVGTSYEPIVLNIRLLNPEKIMFLYTEKSAVILDYIVEVCELAPTEYDKCLVNEVNPLDIYREIKNCYLKWDKPDKMYIDFTGGTKAMSAATALAGMVIDVQLIYVGSNDYLSDFRKPKPGSEKLFYIDNPLAVFGDFEIEKAFALLSRFNYVGAQEKLVYLKDSIPDPNIRTQLNFVYLLAKAYEAWDSLDFTAAHEHMEKLCKELKRDRMHRDFLLMKDYDLLWEQKKVLETLCEIPKLLSEHKNSDILKVKDVNYALMFTMYQNGCTRELQEKYDMATLLFYRLLEMIEQRRLIQYNLYVSKMDYLNMVPDLSRAPEYENRKPREQITLLKSEVLKIRQELFGKGANDYLQEQVSLLDGFVILYALKDPMMDGKNGGINLLKRIRSMVYLRNNSIFAHGLGPVSNADYRKFSSFVTEIFIKCCEMEQVDFAHYLKVMEWVSPERKTLPITNKEEE